MHSLHAFVLQFFVFHDISKPAYLPKSWISPKITNTVLQASLLCSHKFIRLKKILKHQSIGIPKNRDINVLVYFVLRI